MNAHSPDHPGAPRRLLVVMRHGKAESFAEEDHRRELTDRGRRDALDVGRWLVGVDAVPTHAFVSTAARAQGTWDAVAEASGSTAAVEDDESLYAAGPDEVLESLRSAPADAEVVVYVGHNPTAASLAAQLDDGEPDPEAFRALSEGFPTSAAAVLELRVPWDELDAATCRLRAFHVGQG